MFIKKMTTEGTPERVFVLLNLIKDGKGGQTYDKLKKTMELDQPNPYFGAYFAGAEELGLIEENDGAYSIKEEYLDDLNSFDSFRQLVNRMLPGFSEGPLYQLTKSYMQIFPQIIKEYGTHPMISDENVKRLLDQQTALNREKQGLESGLPFELSELRGWRFWASALGFGRYAGNDGMIFLANPARYLRDLISDRVSHGMLKEEHFYSVSEVIEILLPDLDLLITEEQIQNREIPYSLSAGLLSLKDEVLEFRSVMDSELWKFSSDVIGENEDDQMVSLIQIKKETANEQ